MFFFSFQFYLNLRKHFPSLCPLNTLVIIVILLCVIAYKRTILRWRNIIISHFYMWKSDLVYVVFHVHSISTSIAISTTNSMSIRNVSAINRTNRSTWIWLILSNDKRTWLYIDVPSLCIITMLCYFLWKFSSRMPNYHTIYAIIIDGQSIIS